MKFWAGLLIVIHFVVDYQLADSIPVGAYGIDSFLLDLLVIIALFVAFDALNLGRTCRLRVRWSALAMAVAYALFILWGLFTLEEASALWPLWSIEAAGGALFVVCAWKRSPYLLCFSLGVMALAMALLGSTIAQRL